MFAAVRAVSCPGRGCTRFRHVEDVESAIAPVWSYSAKRPRTHSTKPADEHGSQQSMLSPHAPGSVQLAAIVRRQEAVSTARRCSSFCRQPLLFLFLAPSRLGRGVTAAVPAAPTRAERTPRRAISVDDGRLRISRSWMRFGDPFTCQERHSSEFWSASRQRNRPSAEHVSQQVAAASH